VEGSACGLTEGAIHGGCEENHEELQSGQPVSKPRFEAGTFRIKNRSFNHSTTTLGTPLPEGSLLVITVGPYPEIHFRSILKYTPKPSSRFTTQILCDKEYVLFSAASISQDVCSVLVE
jgi:hypothetical protein